MHIDHERFSKTDSVVCAHRQENNKFEMLQFNSLSNIKEVYKEPL